jgi:hypothetical protein
MFIRNHAAHFQTFSVTKALVTAAPPPKAFFDYDWALSIKSWILKVWFKVKVKNSNY